MATKIQFGPMILSPSMEKLMKNKAKAFKEQLANKDDSTHHWFSQVQRRSPVNVEWKDLEEDEEWEKEEEEEDSRTNQTVNMVGAREQEPGVKGNAGQSVAPVGTVPRSGLEEEQFQVQMAEKPTAAVPLFWPSAEPAAAGRKDVGGILRLPHYRQETRGLPSVSTILRETMSEERKRILAAWEERMISQLGEQGFKDMKEATFARGHSLHAWVDRMLAGGEEPQLETIEDPLSRRLVTSLRPVLRDHVTGVLALESSTLHPQLKYCGIVDCVAVLGDTVCLVDWKTSEKTKHDIKSLYDAPLQLAAYIGAVNADPSYRSVGQLRAGAIVVAYNSGYPAAIHRLGEKELAESWKLWVERVELYYRGRQQGA